MKTNKVENKMSTVRAGSEQKMSVLCCKPPFTLKKKSFTVMGAYFPKPSSILGNIKNKPAASTIAKSPTLLT